MACDLLGNIKLIGTVKFDLGLKIAGTPAVLEGDKKAIAPVPMPPAGSPCMVQATADCKKVLNSNMTVTTGGTKVLAMGSMYLQKPGPVCQPIMMMSTSTVKAGVLPIVTDLMESVGIMNGSGMSE